MKPLEETLDLPKTVVITGASRGIGAAIAREMRRRNWRVIGTATGSRNPETFDSGGVDEWWQVNFDNDEQTAGLRTALREVPNLGAFINNAGINIIKPQPAVTWEDYEAIERVDLRGPYFAAAAAAENMAAAGGGRIVNIASIWSVVTKEGRSLYSTMKTGLLGMTRAMAVEWAPRGVLVNAISPGFVMTDLTRKSLTAEQRREMQGRIPQGRFAEPEEIARVAAFLCSQENTYLTGQNLVVDGGFAIQ